MPFASTIVQGTALPRTETISNPHLHLAEAIQSSMPVALGCQQHSFAEARAGRGLIVLPQLGARERTNRRLSSVKQSASVRFTRMDYALGSGAVCSVLLLLICFL